jgi:hypothetical protein
MQYWRIDRAYEKIYRYSERQNAYVFYCSFFEANIKKEYSSNKIIKILNERELLEER